MDYFLTKEKYMIVHQHPKSGVSIEFFDSLDEAKQAFYNNGFTCIDASLVKVIDSTDQEAF